jgi:hypothetical protein
MQSTELDEAFSKFGKIEETWVARDPAKSGFAYVVRRPTTLTSWIGRTGFHDPCLVDIHPFILVLYSVC